MSSQIRFRVQIAFTYEWTTDSVWDTYEEAEERVAECLEYGHSQDRVQIIRTREG